MAQASDRAPVLEQYYTYDAASNRLGTFDARQGAAMTNRDTKYVYDGLHRLQEEQRGNDVGGTWTWAKDSRLFGLDMLGNWATLKFDKNNDGDYVDAGTDKTETRTHNQANEITARDRTTDSSNDDVFTLDDAGNVRKVAVGATVAGVRYTHDAWNRLVKVESIADVMGSEAVGSPALAEYEYNGLHWRTVRKSFDEDGISTGQDVRKLYYSAAWQLIEEHVDDFETSSGSFTKERVMQQFWGLRYIDDAVMRRIDSNADGDYSDAGDRTYFHITDVQFSSVALIDDAAALVERVSYDAYGRARHRPLGDLDGDGDVNATDLALFATAATTYNVDADFDRDLSTSSDTEDTAIFNAADPTAALAVGKISDNSLNGPDNPVGYDGYLYNPEIQMYTVRFRHYHPEFGRWWERDLLEYPDGQSLYQFVLSQPLKLLDPLGLEPPQEGDESWSLIHRDPWRPGGTSEAPLKVVHNRWVKGKKGNLVLERTFYDPDHEFRQGITALDRYNKSIGKDPESAIEAATEYAEALGEAVDAGCEAVGEAVDAMYGRGLLVGMAIGGGGQALSIIRQVTPGIFAARGHPGRNFSTGEVQEFERFAIRARKHGLVQNQYRAGSWGRINANGDFEEVVRLDPPSLTRGGHQKNWRVQFADRPNEHLPKDTPFPGESCCPGNP